MQDNRDYVPEPSDKADCQPNEPVQNLEQASVEPTEEFVQEQAQVQEQEPVQEPAEQPVQEMMQADTAQKIFEQDQKQKQDAQQVYPYKWNYEQQRAADLADKPAKRAHRRGILTYALIVSAVFLLCFGMLTGVLIYDALSPLWRGIGLFATGAEQSMAQHTLESVRNSTVYLNAYQDTMVSIGTGIVLTEDGYIVTNYHIVEDSNSITAYFYDGSSASAELIGFSELDDVAVLKVDARGLEPAKIGSSAEVQDAQTVYALGTPASEQYAWSVTKGIVSYAHREVMIYDDEGVLVKKMQLIQTDVAINPGNSGGPLVNAQGEVLGIVTLRLSGDYTGIGFAVPIDGAMELVQNIIETGEPGDSSITKKRPMLGISGVSIVQGTSYVVVEGGISSDPEDLEKYPDQVFTAEHTGILVMGFVSGLDAANKLQVGDVIVSVEGHTVENIYLMMDIINQFDAGDTIQIGFYRDGVLKSTEIVLGSQD